MICLVFGMAMSPPVDNSAGDAIRAHVIVVDGIEIYDNYWQRAVEEVGARAAFDLNCPQQAFHFKLFAKQGRPPTQVGVIGCDKRATYVRVVMRNLGGQYEAGPWQMNAVAPAGGG